MDESSGEEENPGVSDSAREPLPGGSGGQASVNHKFIWLDGFWDLESRPMHLRNPDVVRDMSYQDLDIQYSRFQKQQEDDNSKHSLLKKDVLPPRVKFPEGKDDGQRKLHPARWLRLPFTEPKVGFTFSKLIKDEFPQNTIYDQSLELVNVWECKVLHSICLECFTIFHNSQCAEHLRTKKRYKEIIFVYY